MFPGMPYQLMEKSLSAGSDKHSKGLAVKSGTCLCVPIFFYE